MRINYNVSAMLSNNAWANNDSALAQSLERLSSGLKINNAKDSPSGLAMAKRMNAQLKGLSVANQNASDGVSVIEIADGALTEITQMIQRMSELDIKAANGTMTDDDRKVIQAEIDQLKAEITRVAETTEYNGQTLLNGEFAAKGYTTDNSVKVNSYSLTTPPDIYKIDNLSVTKDADGVLSASVTLGDKFPEGCRTEVRDNLVTIENSDGFQLSLEVPKDGGTFTDLSVDITGIGAMRLQVGANEGQILEVDIPAISLLNMGIRDFDVTTTEGALEGMDRLDEALAYVSTVRSRLGAYQNRLESTNGTLDITSENITAAYSRIMDVDMAEEMTLYTTNQVLTQAGTSMLAQANERPSQILQLLQ